MAYPHSDLPRHSARYSPAAADVQDEGEFAAARVFRDLGFRELARQWAFFACSFFLRRRERQGGEIPLRSPLLLFLLPPPHLPFPILSPCCSFHSHFLVLVLVVLLSA
eukprot:645621-Hanusia_phi.AAC.1